jgi:macrodomain Ter protein organizer (MatP/YcbG family)
LTGKLQTGKKNLKLDFFAFFRLQNQEKKNGSGFSVNVTDSLSDNKRKQETVL